MTVETVRITSLEGVTLVIFPSPPKTSRDSPLRWIKLLEDDTAKELAKLPPVFRSHGPGFTHFEYF